MISTTHLKLITTGPKESGKTCLVKRHFEERFEKNYIPTIGIDYGLKVFRNDKENLGLNIFDLSGDNYFKSVRLNFYKDCDVFVLCVDLSRPLTFSTLEEYYLEFKNNAGEKKHCIKVLVGTKSDKIIGKINLDKLSAFSTRFNFKLFQTSSEENENVDNVFNYILDKLKK